MVYQLSSTTLVNAGVWGELFGANKYGLSFFISMQPSACLIHVWWIYVGFLFRNKFLSNISFCSISNVNWSFLNKCDILKETFILSCIKVVDLFNLKKQRNTKWFCKFLLHVLHGDLLIEWIKRTTIML